MSLTEWLFRDVLKTITEGFSKMSAELDRLTAEVAEARTVNEGAIALLTGLAQQIRDFQDQPAKLAALADELDSSTKALSDAVSAGTVAEGEENPDNAA